MSPAEGWREEGRDGWRNGGREKGRVQAVYIYFLEEALNLIVDTQEMRQISSLTNFGKYSQEIYSI